MNEFPPKLRLLHRGEEFVRDRSLEAISKSDDLALHISTIEAAADLIHYFIHKDVHRDDDDLTIRLLGMRMFNALNATLKLLLSGYYQASALQQRDIIETFFLLDYFSTDLTLVSRWRMADDKTLKSEFGPADVRKAIDARDGFVGKKREGHYKLFSKLAAHPHPRGFAMLRLPNGDHHCGPFFDDTALIAGITELGRNAVQAGGIFVKFVTSSTKSDFEIELAFIENRQRWCKQFYGQEPGDSKEIEEMRALLAQI